MLETTKPLVTDDMDLFTLLLRLRVQLTETAPADLAWVLPEVLVRCQSGVDDPVGVLEVVETLAHSAPDAGQRSILDALERGVDAAILGDLVELLESLGCDLASCEADALRRLRHAQPGERVHAMYLLCALGPTTAEGCRAVLEADLVRLWRLEQARVEALARGGELSLGESIAVLTHPDGAVRARAEAVLSLMGPGAVEAVPALLAMPPWEGGDDWPSPALNAVGEAAVPSLLAGLNHPSSLVSARAMLVLEAMNALP